MLKRLVVSAVTAILAFHLNASLLFAAEGGPGAIESWVTTPDRLTLFAKQSDTVRFRSGRGGRGATIVVDDRQAYQTLDGFGFALTGGSAELLVKMSPDARGQLLFELFATDLGGIGVSYLRLTIGSSDLNSFVFSYDDLPEGQTDPEMKRFDLGQDKKDVIPVMKQILAINPDIKILASPWSAPAWMKTNRDVRGGHLKEDCYDAYALYLVKYIQAMKQEGIPIDAITIQNEPLNSKNTPSMPWLLSEQREFIKNHLIAAFAKAGLTTKLVLFDHNCDRFDYPLALLNDPDISAFADGSGFHHYGGDLGAMSIVHRARPDKNVYFTEQMITEQPGSSNIAIASAVERMIVNVTRNWSRNVILWNLAADPKNDPHTDNGGCSMCQGAVTLDGDAVTRNLAYYTIAHVSRFVRPGSVRIASTAPGDPTVSLTEDEERPGLIRATVIESTRVMPNVAFKTPDGKIVLIVANTTWSGGSFTIQCDGKTAGVRLQPGTVGTYIW